MKNILRLLASGFVAAFFAHAAAAANLAPGAFSAGTVKGEASFKTAGATEYQKLSAGVALPQGATIKTGANSSVMIVFGSGSTATVQENSVIEVTKFAQEVFSGPVSVDSEPAVSETVLRVVDGGVTSKVAKLKKGSSYTVDTPVGAAGVRGTVFRVSFNRATGKLSIATSTGLVVFNTPSGTSTPVPAGQEFNATVTITTVAAPAGETTTGETTTGETTTTGAAATVETATITEAQVRAIPPEVFDAIVTAVGQAAATGAAQTATVPGTTTGTGSVIVVPVDTTQVGVSPN